MVEKLLETSDVQGRPHKLRFEADGSGNLIPIVKLEGAGGGDASAANQVIHSTRFGDLTEAAPASDTASSGLNGRLQRIAQRLSSLIGLFPTALGQGTMAQSMKVVIASDQSTVNVNQVTSAYHNVQTITRPANTTAYAANDVVGAAAAAISFTSIGPNAARVMITSASLEIDIAAIPAGMTSFRLYLYSGAPPSALADNAAFDLPAGDRASFLGYIDLGTPADLGSTLFAQVNGLNHVIKLAGTSISAYLVTNGAFTPGAVSEVYKITLHTVAV